jgi:hypothetical protein
MAKKKKIITWQTQIFSIFGVLMALVVMPTTALLSVGLLPTFVAGFVDRSPGRTKAITVGALNLAGCFPFLLQLWSQGHTFDRAISIVSNPTAIITMYAAAAVGYFIDWTLTGFVAGIMRQRGQARLKVIAETQEELIKRWGREVSGEIPLDEYGVPLEQFVNKPSSAKKKDL